MGKENTIRIRFQVEAEEQDALIALLSDLGFYAFEEQEENLDAFIGEEDLDEDALNETLQFLPNDLLAQSERELIPPKDWNAEWEKNFEGVTVEDYVEIRPPFKDQNPEVTHSIVVFPKMAFGTGHHATTWMMAEQCRHMDFGGKSVLDMGCGTGVLAILASLEGAEKVLGIDIDEWAWENARENLELNQIQNVEILQGDASAIPAKSCYEILLANINRNVLLEDRDRYREHLCPGGTLVLSGFYTFDEELILDHYQKAGLRLVRRAERDDWVMLALSTNESN